MSAARSATQSKTRPERRRPGGKARKERDARELPMRGRSHTALFVLDRDSGGLGLEVDLLHDFARGRVDDRDVPGLAGSNFGTVVRRRLPVIVLVRDECVAPVV